jgi:Uma2 family endonuclease
LCRAVAGANLGVVRPEKIAHLLTAEEAFWLNPVERWELVEGRIVEVSPVKKRHGRIVARLGRLLEEFVETRRLGEVYVGDVGFILRRDPDTVRAPDLAFIRTARLPEVEEETFSSVVPDMAIEILSPSDRWAEVERKIAEYLTAGVASVWVLDPTRSEARIFQGGKAARILGVGDRLSDPELLPGLEIDIAALLV